jgi:GNAT superfamily N-acetyltransferase
VTRRRPELDGHTDLPAGKIAAIVTSLQMSEPPEPRPDRAVVPWQLRHIERPDLAWFRALYRRIGAEWLWFSRLALGDKELARIIHDDAVAVYALVFEQGEEGLLELDFRQHGICELSLFGLTRELFGTGAGRWLMNRALDLAWSRPITRLWVHTCSLDHPRALSFYLRSGFHPFHRQIEIADDPRLIGLLPREAAPQVPIV